MKVSVVSIAKDKKELEPLKEALKKQTFKDFEFVYSTKKGIPQAMNDAISKAKGEILIITESDCLPFDNNWIRDMVKEISGANENTIILGHEIGQNEICWSNIGGYSKVFKSMPLNESFPVGEDTELFTRMKLKGIKLKRANTAVFHFKKDRAFWTAIKRRYTYGKLLVGIKKKYGFVGYQENIESGSFISREFKVILSEIAYMLGVLRGLL